MPVSDKLRRAILPGVVIVAILLFAAWALVARGSDDSRAASGAPLALFTSLPLYWAEAPDVAAMLKPEGEIHWARAALESRYALRPLDALDPLPGKTRSLLMVQPRPLSPGENVALDKWVRRGGRVLLFADPALTQDSAFALGDKRRPQDMVLLSPILTRWGLGLAFDEDQPLGERMVGLDGAQLPVNLPGQLAALAGGSCEVSHAGLMARCRIGRGWVTVIADAALFERQEQAEAIAPRCRALLTLADAAFE